MGERTACGIYLPLQHVGDEQAAFAVTNSTLSKGAVLACEYGYSVTRSSALVLWEAQFGDFANGAQVVVDQFISAGFARWGQRSSVVMLLPHGQEGAWTTLESSLRAVARPAPLQYAGPAPAASTAPGSPQVHLAQQAELVRSAFED